MGRLDRHTFAFTKLLFLFIFSIGMVLGAQPIMEQGTIDFEAPSLESSARQQIDPYQTRGVTFTALSDRYDDATIGLVKNSATTACVGPKNDDQKLGTGRSRLQGFLGKGAFAIQAEFAEPLEPTAESGVRLSVQFQSLEGTGIRIRLFGPRGTEVASADDTASPAGESCDLPGEPRAETTLSVTTDTPVSSAIMEVMNEGHVFVIDNFSIESVAGQNNASIQTKLARLPNWTKIVGLLFLVLVVAFIAKRFRRN